MSVSLLERLLRRILNVSFNLVYGLTHYFLTSGIRDLRSQILQAHSANILEDVRAWHGVSG